jgi:hypothetical protein
VRKDCETDVSKYIREQNYTGGGSPPHDPGGKIRIFLLKMFFSGSVLHVNEEFY